MVCKIVVNHVNASLYMTAILYCIGLYCVVCSVLCSYELLQDAFIEPVEYYCFAT